ncbi:MAG TPA: O-methyltransferase [Pyrinomonadaceae bacterium]|nr:O-methyltransferase [Pyrinomonadaceae bacterium]
MRARQDAIVRPEQAEYLERLSPPSEGVVAEMEAFAAEHNVPIADREVARFLEITARATGARRVLEIGMAIGYASLRLARSLPAGGLVVTVEPDEEMIEQAEEFLARASVRDRVRVVRGYALEVLPGLSETFDLIYLDAVKEEYSGYLDLALPLLRTGGVVVADNLLWGGQVATEPRTPEKVASTEALREFNRRFVSHPQLLSQVLSIGDGLGYAVKIS